MLVLLRTAMIRFRELGGKVCQEEQEKVAAAFEAVSLELIQLDYITGEDLREEEARVKEMMRTVALEEQWRKLGE